MIHTFMLGSSCQAPPYYVLFSDLFKDEDINDDDGDNDNNDNNDNNEHDSNP